MTRVEMRRHEGHARIFPENGQKWQDHRLLHCETAWESKCGDVICGGPVANLTQTMEEEFWIEAELRPPEYGTYGGWVPRRCPRRAWMDRD